MMILNRRNFFSQSAALVAAANAGSLLRTASAAPSKPVGIGMYAVEEEWNEDPQGTLRALSKMGYQIVEFWGPYLNWTTAQAKDIRKTLDDFGLRCSSTHNDGTSFTAEGLAKAIEFNHIIGSKDLVVSGNNMGDLGGGASAGRVPGGLDGWKRVADRLISFSNKLEPAGLHIGYHNHPNEFTPMDGKLPMQVIAANTPKEVMLQLCVGACVGAHADPVKFIKANPGRIRHIHCKDWSPDKGYEALFGEGVTRWPEVFAAAESVGGLEFYIVEQLGGKTIRTLETARRNITNWKKAGG
jgi:sugar phosphate isomerase/epimerase